MIMSSVQRRAGAGVLCAIIAVLSTSARAQNTFRTPNVVVTYTVGTRVEVPRSVAGVVGAARWLAIKRFGFDLPDTIHVNVSLMPENTVRLYNDGSDHVFLSVRVLDDFRKPSDSKTYHIYGLCHEVAQLAQFSLISDRRWMTDAATEGWARYLGSRLVDGVYPMRKEKLWVDPYDYTADGMQRLEKLLAAGRKSDVNKAAEQWKKLAEIVEDKGVAPIFKAWGGAKVDLADPAPALKAALKKANDDKRLDEWWTQAAPLLIEKQPTEESEKPKRTSQKKKKMTGEPREVAVDDGVPGAQITIENTGHAVRLDGQVAGWYLTGVRINASHYGVSSGKKNFNIFLCDEKLKLLARQEFSSSGFPYDNSKWLTFNMTPVRVPAKFVLCVEFPGNAEDGGVLVTRDGWQSGKSFTALPGEESRIPVQGDWFIRALLDRPKDSAPLQPLK